MTKSTITREESIQAVFDLKVGYPLGLADIEILKRVARMALVAMGSEPVAIIDQANLDYLLSGADADVWPPEREEVGDVLLYRHAQPAPVVPEEMPCGGAADDYHDGYQDGWNACRAAMLQAGTLTNEGTKQAWTGIPDIDNAINMLDRIDTLDSCDDDRIEAVKTVLRRLAGNSPVIPDGYVMVPKEMTDEIGEAIAMQANCCGGIALDIYDAMLAAAPHDTPSLNSLQSVDSVADRWIPVSERMPESNGMYFGWDGKRVLEVYCFFGGFSANQFIHGEITHWMPLPVGPQEVKSES